jgi:hypothetical protein
LTLVLAATALAENYRYRFTAADQALAARIVHRAQAAGWKGGPVKPDLSPNQVFCPGVFAPKQSDLVVTGAKETDYTYKTGQELNTYATVFQTPAMLETDWRRGATAAPFFKCLRSKWSTIAGRGSRIVSLSVLSLPGLGARSFAYRVVFTNTAHQRVAVDSVTLARGRIEAEVDQIAETASAAELANMKAGDRYVATALERTLLAAS